MSLSPTDVKRGESIADEIYASWDSYFEDKEMEKLHETLCEERFISASLVADELDKILVKHYGNDNVTNEFYFEICDIVNALRPAQEEKKE